MGSMTLEMNLSNLKKIEKFLGVISQYEGEFWLLQGKQKINAKEVYEIFSLDLSLPVLLSAKHLQRNKEKELYLELIL